MVCIASPHTTLPKEKMFMDIMYDNTIVASLTVGQLLSILKSFLGESEATEDAPASKNYVYGLRGIQDLFQCSHTQAQRYKDGLLKPAVIQSGRKIMVDVDTAIKLFNQKEG